eukprot:gene5235-8846_t
MSTRTIDYQKDKSMYLCSCGQSSKLPLCDGTHSKINGGKTFKPVQVTVKDDNKLDVLVIKEKVLKAESEEKKAKAEAEEREDFQTPLLLFAASLFGAFMVEQFNK